MGEARSGAFRAGRGRLVAWLPAIAWAGLIFVLSAQPGLRFAPDDATDFVLRKAGHMAVFGILALLLWSAVAVTTTRERPWAWALALSVAYAMTDELHQGSVPMRHASGVDVGIDTAGALVALAALAFVRSRRSRTLTATPPVAPVAATCRCGRRRQGLFEPGS